MALLKNEARRVDHHELRDLRKLVAIGEGLHLEFKRKVAFPEKIIREMMAFANTSGGVLLVGVNDDGALSGIRYPEEESLLIRNALRRFCRPTFPFEEIVIAVSANKFILKYDIPPSDKRPHRFWLSRRKSETYIRVNDMSIKASPEMSEIVYQSKFSRDVQFTYGQHESTLMKYLADNNQITLPQFQKLTGLSIALAARTLVTLVLARVIKIVPTEKGDLYLRGT